MVMCFQIVKKALIALIRSDVERRVFWKNFFRHTINFCCTDPSFLVLKVSTPHTEEKPS